jgi:hypothetical protein
MLAMEKTLVNRKITSGRTLDDAPAGDSRQRPKAKKK